MRKYLNIMLTIALVIGIAGCTGRQSRVNSYLLPEGGIGGDESKKLAAVENIIVWPMNNVAAGSAAKGVELVLTDYLVDNLYLDDAFKSVYILAEGDDKDLMERAGEELGMKKKPKEPIQGALVLTKIGQLTGTQAILMGRVDDYDEVKVDKATYTTVGISLFLYDAREQSYPSLDSFTPVKTLWRTNAVRHARETAFLARPTLHETARILTNQVVERLRRDFARGSEAARREFEMQIDALKDQASNQLEAGEYDAAVATWNEILELDPENGEVAGAIERIEAMKAEAEESARLKELQEQIDGLRTEAVALEEAGDLEGALGQWNQLLELNAEDEEAKVKAESLNEALSALQAQERETEIAKNLHLAQQALGESRYSEAVKLAKKVLALEPQNAKAQSILEAAELKLEEIRAVDEEAAPPPEVEEEPLEEAAEEAREPVKAVETEEIVEEEVPEAEAEAEVEAEVEATPEASSEVEKLRNQAMEYFNGEDYEKAEEAWKKLLEVAPEDKQALEMLETTQMLIEALK